MYCIIVIETQFINHLAIDKIIQKRSYSFSFECPDN